MTSFGRLLSPLARLFLADMPDERPTSQHMTKTAGFGIRGDVTALKQVADTGYWAQKKRSKVKAEGKAAAESWNQGKTGFQGSSTGQKK